MPLKFSKGTILLKYLGLIPARGGSKGLPGKNLRRLGNRPMLQYTIDAAMHSQHLSRRILSSDDSAMIDLARHMGCHAPFVRPTNLATDQSPIVDTALHALDWLEKNESICFENLVLLQPTCPFRDSGDIDDAIAQFEKAHAKTLVSVNPVMQHPWECIRIDGKRLDWTDHPNFPATIAKGRQTFPPFYFINGAIYIVEVDFLREKRIFQDENSIIYMMENSHSLDINDLFEFQLASGLLTLAQKGEPVFSKNRRRVESP